MSTTLEAPRAEPLADTIAATTQDLAKYDSRRATARAIDGVFVGAPFLVPVLGLGLKLSVLLVAVCLLYFFVCEAVWGQTIGKRIFGLRVQTRDSRPASATAVAGRTITRLVDDGPIGLLVFLASGKRRGRLGDLLADTIVAPAPGLPRAGFSPLLLVYPAVLVAAAAAVVLAFSGVEARHDYLRAADHACARSAKRDATSPARDFDALLARKLADHRALAAVKAPGGARKLRAEILSLDARVDRALGAAVTHSGKPTQAEITRIAAARQVAAKRYAKLGLRSCAGLGAV
jgi:uncharacterized RDD family membrane protein YckC